MIMVKCIFYWTAKKENDKVYQIVVELPKFCTVQEALKKVLKYMNEEIKASGVQLATELSYYSLHYAKKNGQPKSDYPGNVSLLL